MTAERRPRVPPGVRADADRTWAALVAVDLIEVGKRKPLVGVLGGLRALPEMVVDLLHGEGPPGAPQRMRLHDMPQLEMDAGGWLLMGWSWWSVMPKPR